MLQRSRFLAQLEFVREHRTIARGVDDVFPAKLFAPRRREAHPRRVDLEVTDGRVLPDNRAVPDRQVGEISVDVLPEEVDLLVAVNLRRAELLRLVRGL